MLIAATLSDRLFGASGDHPAVLLKTNSVHGRSLVSPLALVGIDSDGEVVALKRLPAGGTVRISEATWILELPSDAAVPDIGTGLEIYARRCDWETRSLWDSNRQPWRCV